VNYSVGHIGRVIVLKLDDNEDVLASVESVVVKENIKSGLFFVIGSLKEGSVVSGAETDELPIVPMWLPIHENHEILGIGTLFQMEGHPKIHLHAALARKDDLLMGCLREKSKVFLLEEIVILEVSGVDAVREKDGRTGLSLLKIG
jgi:predicted DNA-binding protein with PD1-like motif